MRLASSSAERAASTAAAERDGRKGASDALAFERPALLGTRCLGYAVDPLPSSPASAAHLPTPSSASRLMGEQRDSRLPCVASRPNNCCPASEASSTAISSSKVRMLNSLRPRAFSPSRIFN